MSNPKTCNLAQHTSKPTLSLEAWPSENQYILIEAGEGSHGLQMFLWSELCDRREISLVSSSWALSRLNHNVSVSLSPPLICQEQNSISKTELKNIKWLKVRISWLNYLKRIKYFKHLRLGMETGGFRPDLTRPARQYEPIHFRAFGLGWYPWVKPGPLNTFFFWFLVPPFSNETVILYFIVVTIIENINLSIFDCIII